MRAELVVDCRNAHGEGVLWSHEHGLLMWTDINGERIWTYDPVTGKQDSHKTPGRVGCFAPREGRPSHELIAGFADAFAFVDLATGRRKEIAAFEPDLPTTRLNDGRTDRAGRLDRRRYGRSGTCADFLGLARRCRSWRDPTVRRGKLRQLGMFQPRRQAHVFCRQSDENHRRHRL